MSDWGAIARRIGEVTGSPFELKSSQWIGGGCINDAVLLGDGSRNWFVKFNDASRLEMFEAEAEGLKEMAASRTIRVPEPLCSGVDGARSYLVMEYIEMGRSHRGSGEQAGRELAAMHRTEAKAFGWSRDNTIGSTPQHNAFMDDWIDFWRERRLGFQLGLAARKGFDGRLQQQGERLLERFPALMGHEVVPSLLHGDLWGGNIAYDHDGNPVIFDPAVYYGDREADLAMTELFGGFGSGFYAAYSEAWPLDSGYRVRKVLYNLYHILNHFNLFGGGYLAQAQSMIDRLLAEC